MPPLARDLRQALERAVVDARSEAESAAQAALAALAVDQERPFEGLSESQRALRRALRAKERQLGSYEALVVEIAYQHWHRMLFARFLAENGLLIHPDAGVPVTLEAIADLAREDGEPDPWVLAARYAARMLPAIFREGDPELEVRFAPEGRRRLEDILGALPPAVFTSDDGLGWVYQFWQSEKKREVNRSGVKIGAAELPAVTQLFTEDYMVRFLLENSLGAWWAGRHPDSPLLERFTYLRLTDEGAPAAGTFGSWPETVAEVTVMDPCCGSGHFLTVAFEMLAGMRAEEEGLSAAAAGDAVISDNLFGLEIDPRCTQIAAFALALSAWRSGGHRQLPTPNLACSGIGVAGQLADWKKLARGDASLENALTALHEQFKNAPELGSLIDPRRATVSGNLFSIDYDKVAPLLECLLEREEDPETQVAGWAAAGIARAAALLAGSYTLIATNPPFLLAKRQPAALREYSHRHHADCVSDLAATFFSQAERLGNDVSGLAFVLPQTVTNLATFARMRVRLLMGRRWSLLAQLGSSAFTAISGEVVNAVLLVAQVGEPPPQQVIQMVDVSAVGHIDAKALALSCAPLSSLVQESQLTNPEAILMEPGSGPILAASFESLTGSQTNDRPRFVLKFWELLPSTRWVRQLRSVQASCLYGGRDEVVDTKVFTRVGGGRPSPRLATGRKGLAIARMGYLAPTLYRGEPFDQTAAVLLAKSPTDEVRLLLPLWAFAASGALHEAVRKVDRRVGVTPGSFLKVPFDLKHWTKVAEELYPDGLPEPHSDDPTQWLFRGDPTDSTDPLQVAVARLLGYRWPDQEPDVLDELADADGAVPIPALAGEVPAAQRLRVLLERAWGDAWTQARLSQLLSQVGAGGKDLDGWLRDDFFSSHARLFHNRPFIWHIWDGRKDGFGVLVNYHRLDRQLLDRITHTLLGEWIEIQRHQAASKVAGAEARLVAAVELQRRLEQIAVGEPPHDIFVRWKDLHEQPIGWDPDLNDGVRLNIRPFVTAGVLRSKFSINWNKDRGNDSDGSQRLNDLHHEIAEKKRAREGAEG